MKCRTFLPTPMILALVSSACKPRAFSMHDALRYCADQALSSPVSGYKGMRSEGSSISECRAGVYVMHCIRLGTVYRCTHRWRIRERFDIEGKYVLLF